LAARAVLSLLSSSSRQRTAKRTCPPPRLPQHAKPFIQVITALLSYMRVHRVIRPQAYYS
jgi:hypothetical protein